MGRSLSLHLALLVLLATHANAGAVTVHTWIDGDGVRHYSDAPPASATADLERFVIADTPASATASDEDYYSIVNQWQRMREERDESKAHRLERERIRSEERVAKAAARADEARYNSRGYGGYYPRLPYGYGRHFGHSGVRGFGGFHHGSAGGFAGTRHNAFAHAAPPVRPRVRMSRV